MSEPKPLASLTASLLARKGQARPAMRPQASRTGQDDLGWNDMGASARRVVMRMPTAEPAAPAAPPPPVPPVIEQRAALEAALAPAPKPRAAPGSKGKAAFTLRLEPERHLQLRLASAYLHRSAQNLVTEALDRFLADLAPEIEARKKV